MPKARLGVALLVPAPTCHEIDGLRRALGEPFVERVPPHLTLVPPVNVRHDALGATMAVLREAASLVGPVTVTLGPVIDFLPDNPTLFLRVGGEPAAIDALHRLRDAVFRPPLERRLTWPFVPHVTVHDDHPPEAIAGAEAALAGYRTTVTFGSVHLLEEQRHGESHRRWVPVAEVRLGPPPVVGRGGLPLTLHVSGLVDPEAGDFLTRERAGTREALEGGQAPEAPSARADDLDALPPGARPVVVTGVREGAVVGVARGWSGAGGAELTELLVAADARGHGIGRHLAAAFDHEADGSG
ncbi:MAG: GNAT family N-acetyltransferase [Acidimicrobiales bacterium]